MAVQQYLQRTANGYRFRRGVPKELQAILGKTEYIVSLKTHDKREATKRVWRAAIDCDAAFEQARNADALTADQAATMVDEWRDLEQKRLTDTYAGASEEDAELHQASFGAIHDRMEMLDGARTWRRWPAEVRAVVEEVLSSRGMVLAADTPPYNRIALAVTNAQFELLFASRHLRSGCRFRPQ